MLWDKSKRPVIVGIAVAILVCGILAYNSFVAVGREQGYAEGHEAGYTEGYEAGIAEYGYTEEDTQSSYDDGYADGYADGESLGGYDAGYSEGYDDGFQTGRKSGYDLGYSMGQMDVQSSSRTTSGNSQTVVETPTETKQSITVYITNTGEKYHRAGCQYLRQSQIAISLDEARERGYTACSKCW